MSWAIWTYARTASCAPARSRYRVTVTLDPEDDRRAAGADR